jgi:hypothetical protein
MTKPNKLCAGDRIAYAAKFLKNTAQFTGAAPQRRGTFVGYWPRDPQFARVKWDDFEECCAQGGGQYGDTEWTADAREHGAIVHANNIAKVGSPRFALNCM